MITATLIYLSGWVVIGIALAYRIRQNRKKYRMNRANRSTRAWVRNRGRWHEFDE